jgi:hypothetical protein
VRPPRQVDVPHAAADLTPAQKVAAAVLWQAALDAQSSEERRRLSARSFFAGGTMFAFWCETAWLDPAIVQARVARLDRGATGPEAGGPGRSAAAPEAQEERISCAYATR